MVSRPEKQGQRPIAKKQYGTDFRLAPQFVQAKTKKISSLAEIPPEKIGL